MVKFFAAVILTMALGIGVAYAVNRVGDLNRQAIVIDTCLNLKQGDTQQKYCPNQPYSAAEAKSLRNTADTLGSLGWLAFLFLVFGVGGTAYEYISD